MKLLMLYILLINIVAIVLTVSDKIFAIRGSRRISEKALLVAAVLGGAVGMYCTMLFIRHKTLHSKFMIGLPLIILSQLAIAAFIFVKICS